MARNYFLNFLIIGILLGLASIDVGNNYLRHKNPYKAIADEKRMLQARAGGACMKVGMFQLYRIVTILGFVFSLYTYQQIIFQ